MDIPLIDIAPLAGTDEPARAHVAAAIGRACRDIGLFAVTGHGLAPGATRSGTGGLKSANIPGSAGKSAVATG